MLTLQETVEREWLSGRFHVLELASLLDRLERLTESVAAEAEPEPARGQAVGVAEDIRMALLRRAIDELHRPGADRTARILRLYTEMAPRG